MFATQKRKASGSNPVVAEAETATKSGARAGLKGKSFAEGEAALSPVQRKEDAAAKDEAAVGSMDPKGILSGLHPAMAARTRQLLLNAKARGLNVYIFEGMRSHARQNELYAQGRTKPGNKVTWVKAGGSYHQYGMAVDIVFNSRQPWGEQHDWNGLGAAGEAAGLRWGASFGDRPHFQMMGVSIADLSKWYRSGGLPNAWEQASKVFGGGGVTAPTLDGGDGTYRVRSGDTLVVIAQRFFGKGNMWRAIADLNGISDPRALEVGSVLQIPNQTGKGAADVEVEYKIGKGDTLGRIAKSLYGDASRWEEIAVANGITDPRALTIGQVIKVPPANGKKATIPAPTFVTVTVKSGDTLAQIASKHLGSAKRWREIADANGISDPTKLSIGTALKIAT